MEKRTNKVEKMIKDFESKKRNIQNSYSKDQFKEMQNLDKQIAEIKRKQEENSKKDFTRENLHIQRLEEELNRVNPMDRELIAQYKESIKEASKPIREMEEEKNKAIKEIEEKESKKQELLLSIKNEQTTNKNNIERATREAEDELRGSLTREKMSIESDIEKKQLNMQQVLLKIKNFKYKYEEKDGVKIPLNGDKLKSMNDEYNKMQDELNDLKKAKKMCEGKLEEFKLLDIKRMEKINNILNEKTIKTNDEKGKNGENGNHENGGNGNHENGGKDDGEGNKDKITSIKIDERQGNIYVETNRPDKKLDLSLEDAFRNKKSLYKRLDIKKICREIAGNRIKGRMLSMRVNPAIVASFGALYPDSEQLKSYIASLKTKKELPFELLHDLRNSRIKHWKENKNAYLCFSRR